MAIVYTKQKNIQKSLVLVFIIVLLIIAAVIWQGFLKEEKETSLEQLTLPRGEIKIDFELLKSSFLEKLQLFSEIKPFKVATPTEEVGDEIGRENPFLPY